jgi:dTDP-4-amino-4,6-dideoxygalactose transaminase
MRLLAILGGEPAFKSTIHVGRPNMGDRKRFHDYVDRIYDNRYLTNRGPLLRQFEQELAQRLGAKHCIAVCNATIALEIAIRALGLQGQVILPSFTFIATAHALQWQGITPVFCDIDPHTHTIDPGAIEKLITPQTTGIIGVHLWGRPCAVEALQQIADSRNLRLLFDAAHAFACSHKGVMIGNFGDAEVFSFHATKFLNTFEGGAIATNNDDLAAQMRLMVNFGFADYDRVVCIGTNGKMSEISAAMGLTNLESLEAYIGSNQQNFHRYQEQIADIPGLSVLGYNEEEKNNFQYIVVEVDPNLSGLHRDMLLKVLLAENVLARRYFWPGCHRMEPYCTLFPEASLHLPDTERITERVLVLPNGTALQEADISAICDVLRTAVTEAGTLEQYFAHSLASQYTLTQQKEGAACLKYSA